MIDFLLDAAAGAVLLLVFASLGHDMWHCEPNTDKRVNAVSVIIGLAIVAAAIYRAGLHW